MPWFPIGGHIFIMHFVLVHAAEKPFAIFESGKMSRKRGDKWFIMAKECCAGQAQQPFSPLLSLSEINSIKLKIVQMHMHQRIPAYQ